jgi:hypothetical protein
VDSLDDDAKSTRARKLQIFELYLQDLAAQVAF